MWINVPRGVSVHFTWSLHPTYAVTARLSWLSSQRCCTHTMLITHLNTSGLHVTQLLLIDANALSVIEAASVLVQMVKLMWYTIGLYRIGIESIQPNTNSCTNYSAKYEYESNSSMNKQILGFAYFDKHYAVLTLMLLYARMIQYRICLETMNLFYAYR